MPLSARQAKIAAGCIMIFVGSITPEGFLLCDGSAISRVNYLELFNAIGVQYGAGDGVSTALGAGLTVGVSNNDAYNHTHDVNIPQFNSGTSNPPFLVVNYIIKT